MQGRFSLSIVIAMAAFAAAPVHGQQPPPGILRGTVVDEVTGGPLATARVELLGQHRQDQTHEDGAFVFAGLVPGRYTLVIQRIGYRMVTHEVTVPAGEVTERITLAAAAVQLAPTVVTGTTRERAGEDVLSPTSVLSGAQLDSRLSATVAATLQTEPGVAVTSLGPATSRPVIRGMSGDRVVILEDGQRPGDLSAMSSDHAVAIEPLTARQIEVVRGPMSLLYGSSALGGVINVIRDEIPTSLPDRVHGVVSAQGASVAPGGSIGAAATAKLFGLAWKLEGSGRSHDDVRTPEGTLVNTDARTFDAALGVGSVGEHGHGGASYRFYQNDYGIPGGFVGGHPAGVDIHMRRHTTRGELERHLSGAWSTMRAGAVYTDYQHTELESSGSVGTFFQQRVAALDAVANHEEAGPFRLGAIGLRGQYRDLQTGGTLRTPSTYDFNAAAFVVEELGSDRVRVQAGARYDWARVVPRDSTAYVGVGGERLPVHPRTFGNVSGSLGLLYVAGRGITAGISVARAFRIPDVTELFSNGPHLADNTYNVGDPELLPEKGYGVDAFVRLSLGPVQGQAAVFGNWLVDYIFPSSRGRADLGPQGSRPRFQYTNEDARFIGAEASVLVSATTELIFEGSVSHVVAKFTAPRDSIPVFAPGDTTFVAASIYPPFIPPLHGRVGVRYERAKWFLGGGAQFASAQERLGDFETRTPGYVVGDVAAGVRLLAGDRLHTLTLRIENVANRTYYDHMSRLKEIMPEPGRNVSLLYRLTF
jgi:iron complex outermembrane receptor protein